MSETPTLFTDYMDAPTAEPDAIPICPICRLRPVRRNLRTGSWNINCAGMACGNHQRKCHWCDNTYIRHTPGAGSKYCSDSCKRSGYQAHTISGRASTLPKCAICGRARKPVSIQADVCHNCSNKHGAQIRSHHLNTEWAVRLITARMCDACGDPLAVGYDKHRGQVDHDHACCGKNSCGECVRGIVCNQCNTMAAMMENNPHRTDALRKYLGQR